MHIRSGSPGPQILIGWTVAAPGSAEIIPGEGHIRHFATHPDWLGRRIGTSLLARCFADAGPVVHRLYCYSSLNAEPFYLASGFEAIGPVDVPIGSGLKFAATLMKRELPARAGNSCYPVL
ncbi:MAG TPA: GNAT family N-acetyltransferase [Rhizomicrobium sp.]|jgi:GNAT superfamily N-acetyltransferase|nr:GNAT family N-acetyltransferase [Rhizomicrobium sp.]